jgi:hypothetical protein
VLKKILGPQADKGFITIHLGQTITMEVKPEHAAELEMSTAFCSEDASEDIRTHMRRWKEK